MAPIFFSRVSAEPWKVGNSGKFRELFVDLGMWHVKS